MNTFEGGWKSGAVDELCGRPSKTEVRRLSVEGMNENLYVYLGRKEVTLCHVEIRIFKYLQN
jgi:hypothetical protein